MPKEKYTSPQVGCLVASCKRMAPAHFPICSTHWSVLPPFVLGYLESCGRSGGRRWAMALEWAADYLDITEEFPE